MTTPIREFRGAYRFLSNFWPAYVEYEGVVYPSVEHAYVAAKTTDKVLRQKIADAHTPGQAKRLGKRIRLRRGWNNIKLSIMRDLVKQKFKDQHLLTKLRATAPATLIEGNHWHDNFWGQCVCDHCSSSPNLGQNHLGRILMEIRDD